MKYIVDNDLHIHSYLSLCSQHPEQTPRNILQYAKDNNLTEICLTDHFWDESLPPCNDWYRPQDFAHIVKAMPLPQGENVRFRFGCETELTKDLVLGITPATMEKLDFVIIPTTHFHMFKVENSTPQKRADMWLERFDHVLDRDLPFHKIGIAHMTCPLWDNSSWEAHIEACRLLQDDDLNRLFEKAAHRGVGIELNLPPLNKYTDEQLNVILRPYRIAKDQGCKFYCGSDAHTPDELKGFKARQEKLTELLNLQEEDKFYIGE